MHDLEFNTDGIAMFATRQRNLQKVWWRGQTFFSEDLVLPDNATTEDLIVAAGFRDHKILQSDLIADYGGEIQRLIGLGDSLQKKDARYLRALVKKVQAASELVEMARLVYRENDRKHLSVMGKDYCPVQFMEVYAVLDALVESGEITLETLGSLRDGKGSFMAAKLTGAPLEIVPSDIAERYLVASDSYDGTSALMFLATLILTVCRNTEAAGIREANRTGRISKQKHTKGIKTRLADARKALGIATEQFKAYETLGKALARIKMSADEVEAFHSKLVFGDKPIPADVDNWSGQQRRAVGELGFMMTDGPGQEIEGRKGTAWGALNSVTAWTNHVKRHKSSTEVDRTNFVLFGNGAELNADARRLLVSQYQLAA